MAIYTYKAKDSSGEVITGTLEAESNGIVVSRLQSMGYYPVAIENETEKKQAAGGAKTVTGRVRVGDLATFNRQLADLLASGMPLVKALTVIQSQTTNGTLVAVITQLNQDVSGGDALAEAMAKHPRVFSKLACAMVKSGEAGGNLDQVLSRLADFAETDAETRSKIFAALAYPMVMVIAGIGAVVIMMTVVMPKILGVYGSLNQALPLMTQLLIEANAFLVNYWYIVLGAMAAMGLVFYRAARTPDGRRFIDRVLLKIPLIGDLVLKREVANFARTLGSLLRNGVSILPALEIVREVLGNRIVADEVATIPQNVTQGEGIAAPLKKSKVFPAVVVNMMAIGEETGRLDEVLLKVARSYDMEVERSVKTLTGLIEPIIILVLGVVVGFIVISMLLPIFALDPSAGS